VRALGGMDGRTLTVERGREGTTAATHAKDAELTWLAAGAS
jgi:hypothetical protein